MNKIYKYLKGYLSVCADGRFCERLINICMHRNMPVWDVKRCGEGRITFKTDISSFKQMRKPARRTGSRVRIMRRHGVPFLIRRYRRRKPAAAAIVLAVAVLWYASNHIMGITIFGNELLTTEEILAKLESCGVELGARTSQIDPDIIRNRMMTGEEKLAWVGINANGSRVYVEIVERIEKEKGIVKDGTACNLIASRDGEIEQLIVREGQTMVTDGSGVREGDVLVSGIVDGGKDGFRYVRARGEVYARTRYTKTGIYPLQYNERLDSGQRKNRYTLSVMNFSLPVFLNKKEPYEDYDYRSEKKEYRIPIDILPSVFVTREEYIEKVSQPKRRTPNEAVEAGKAELTAEMTEELPHGAEILETNYTHSLNEHGEAEVTVEIICRENIAMEAVLEASFYTEEDISVEQ